MTDTALATDDAFADLPLAELTVPGMLLVRARATPDRVLLRGEGGSRTAAQQVEVVARVGQALRDGGIGAGDRIAVLAANRLEVLDHLLAAGWIGAIAAPINPESSAAQLAHALHRSGARIVLADAAGVASLAGLDDLADVERVWSLDGAAAPVAGVPVEDVPQAVSAAEPAAVRPGDPFAFLFTSGTTGPAKGVVCPHAQFYWWGRTVGDHMRLTDADVLYTNLPLFHTNAINAFFQAVVAGAEFVLAGKFSASRFWGQVAEARATFTYLLGAMVGILLNRPEAEYVPHGVRAALAPAIPPHMLTEFRDRFGVQLVDGFGSTETNFVLGVPLDDPRPGSIGVVLPGYTARVVDEVGEPAPDGVAGELLLRSDLPWAFATGYHEQPDETVKAWTDLWFHTGDRVVRDADGWFRFVDRIKDVIRRRGENISSVEVEGAVRQHPAVAECAAYAVPSELGEDEVQVSVELRDGATIEPAELVEFLVGLLPAYAVPRFVAVEDEMPRTPNGKLSKGVMRDRGGDVDRWDRQA